MSAFLGPVHFMLYNKIQRQNELLNEIINASEENHWVNGIADQLKEKCGENETAPLETVIDESAIHNWLNNQVSIAESRMAFALKLILEKDSSLIDKVSEIFYSNGAASRLDYADIIVAEELFNAVNMCLLDGMPCDGGITVESNDGSEIVWSINMQVHTPFYESEGLNSQIFLTLRDKWLQGFFAGSFNIDYARLSENTFRIMEV